MPSELFYTVNILSSITISVIGVIFSLLIIFIIVNNRQCYTVTNLLLCDLCVTLTVYLILNIIGCFYGLRNDWYSNQPLCIIRAYCTMVLIAASSYSFLIQSISRLFFAVFFKYKYLLTWRTHWILIILKWFISLLVSIEPFFIEHGFELIQDYRMCEFAPKILSVTLYCCIVLYIFPVSIVVIVYGIILYQVRQSTRRITPNPLPVHTSSTSCKRNLKIMQNMLFLLNILLCGGTLYLILTLWNIIQYQSIPKELYLLSINLVILAATTMAVVSFFTNKTIKEAAYRYFARYHLFTL